MWQRVKPWLLPWIAYTIQLHLHYLQKTRGKKKAPTKFSSPTSSNRTPSVYFFPFSCWWWKESLARGSHHSKLALSFAFSLAFSIAFSFAFSIAFLLEYLLYSLLHFLLLSQATLFELY